MKLEFNSQQLQILNAAIVELPFRIAAPLIQEINRQIKDQSNIDIGHRNDLDNTQKQS